MKILREVFFLFFIITYGFNGLNGMESNEVPYVCLLSEDSTHWPSSPPQGRSTPLGWGATGS